MFWKKGETRYCRRDMRSFNGILRSCSYGRMIPKWHISKKTYEKLSKSEKKKYVAIKVGSIGWSY